MSATQPAPAADKRASRTPPLSDTPALAEQAMSMLRLPAGIAPLTPDDTRCIVGYLRLVAFPKGSAMLREGDDSSTYLLLLLEGEVEVDAGSGSDAMAIGVLGPGSIIGEMALLDGSPRSATCTALTPVIAAGLSGRGLQALLAAHPAVAARLAFGLAQRVGDRLRALGQQMQMVAQLNAALQADIASLRSGAAG